MGKHTPAPWDISDTGPKYSINAGTGGAARKHIAMVSCFKGHEGEQEENEANARLIAAAPEMLEALKEAHEAVSYLVAFIKDGELSGCSDAFTQRWVDHEIECERIIRKAEGTD